MINETIAGQMNNDAIAGSKKLFLCGFMGCGKSTIGKKLASRLDRPFVDMDNFIESKEQMSIPEIFEKYGEGHFRELERHYLEVLGQEQGGLVVATGGGALLNPENSRIAKTAGVVIFLDAPFGLCYKRIAGDPNRPLAASSDKERLHNLYNTREPIYRSHSDFTVDAQRPLKQILSDITTFLL